MKDFLKSLKRQDGFTLVELMVVVAIIGLLSAVAIPNFKKYQAKAKSSEAKVQLAAAYTAEQAFYGDFGMYGHCLSYMGYDPSDQINSRYYAVGFTTDVAYNTSAHATAVNSGLFAANCTVNGAHAAGSNSAWYPGGKGNGATIVDDRDAVETNSAIGVTTALIGTQAGGSTQTFVIGAVGVISGDNAATNFSDASAITMDENKLMSILEPGY
jgi:type IV pilus assembly protein PilA